MVICIKKLFVTRKAENCSRRKRYGTYLYRWSMDWKPCMTSRYTTATWRFNTLL